LKGWTSGRSSGVTLTESFSIVSRYRIQPDSTPSSGCSGCRLTGSGTVEGLDCDPRAVHVGTEPTYMT
jgi:hypothetical protein